MRLRDVSDVDNQVPYHGVVGAARFLRRHLVLTVADAVKQNTIRLAGHSLQIREVGNRQAHALGDISLAVAVVSMAHGTVDLIKILGLGLRFSGWLYRIAFGGRGGGQVQTQARMRAQPPGRSAAACYPGTAL